MMSYLKIGEDLSVVGPWACGRSEPSDERLFLLPGHPLFDGVILEGGHALCGKRAQRAIASAVSCACARTLSG
jgi:hypothetical protein